MGSMKEEYFDWMYNLVCDDEYSKGLSYRKLLRYLNEVDFTYSIDMDGNRADDGIDLRYRFAFENKYDNRRVVHYIDNTPCSVLEMMIALALRCEEHIMENSDYGNRTGQWFWNMIVSLGLGGMSDDHFDIQYVREVIDRFLNRDYERNGKGGLFTVEHGVRDMRSIEIWYQMCLYLDDII